MEPLTLTTERLELRPFAPRDADAVLRACQDADIQRWTTIPSPYRREHAEGFVNDICPRGWEGGTLLNFGTFTRQGGELVSSLGLYRTNASRTEDRRAEVGFWTAREHRGRGYTTEAVLAVARWAFTDLGIERLEWLAEVGNVGSRAVAQKAGFVMEGALRSRIVSRGVRRDAWVGALLPSDLGVPAQQPYLPSDRDGK